MVIDFPSPNPPDRPESVRALLGEISSLPANMRSVVAMNVAAELTQFAAYEAANLASRAEIADLIAMSADLESNANSLKQRSSAGVAQDVRTQE